MMWKAIKSLFSGLLATVSPQRFADAGVKVGVAFKPQAIATGGLVIDDGVSLMVPEGAWDDLEAENKALKLKLEAAADALRRIECICGGSQGALTFSQTLKAGEIATVGYRAATQA